MVGILMNLTTITSCLMYALILVSIFMETPKEKHWLATKIIIWYVNRTKRYGILYTTINEFRMVAYIGNEWKGV